MNVKGVAYTDNYQLTLQLHAAFSREHLTNLRPNIFGVGVFKGPSILGWDGMIMSQQVSA